MVMSNQPPFEKNGSEESLPKEPSFFVRFGQRVVVHLLGISLGYALDGYTSTLGLMAYIGFISLVPRGDWRKPLWYMPFGLGLLQTVVAVFLGISLGMAVFLGGMQSWLARIIQKKGRLSWDWIMLPFVVAGFDALYRTYPPLFLWLSFVVIAIIGFVLYLIYMKGHADTLLEEELRNDCAKMEQLLRNKYFPKDLEVAGKLFAQQSTSMLKNVHGAVASHREALEKIHACQEALSKHVRAIQPSKSSGWAHGLLKSENFGRKGDDTVHVLLKETNAFLAQELRKFRTSKEDGGFEATLQGYEDMAMQLQMASAELPAHLSQHTIKIAETSLDIVRNMREDPADRPSGDRFLGRYLPAVQKIVDEYMRLSQGPAQQDVQDALARSLEVLERMEKAFEDELKSLMQNDAINFSAEVDAIDAMLKMKGH